MATKSGGRKKKSAAAKQVEALKHTEAKRKNISSAEHQSVMREEDKPPIQLASGPATGVAGEAK